MHSHNLEGINLKSILIIFGLSKAVQLHDFGAHIPLLREEHVNNLGLEGVH
jgi:hypothetical protein